MFYIKFMFVHSLSTFLLKLSDIYINLQYGIMGIYMVTFLCPQRNFGRQIVITLSIRQSIHPSRFVSGAYPLYRNPKFGVWMHLGMAECRVPFSGHCDLDLDL